MKYNKRISYDTSETIINHLKEFLGIEDERDFPQVTVELALWISSEMAVGRKVISVDKYNSSTYECPKMNKQGIQEIMKRRAENCTVQVKREEQNNKNDSEDLDWLKNNIG